MSMAKAKAERSGRKVAWRSDFPFTFKAIGEEKDDLELDGYASTWVKDRDDEWIDPDAYEGSLDAYLAKNPMVLYMHEMKWPVGSCEDAKTDEFGLIIKDIVPKPGDKELPEIHTCYEKTKRGILRTLSVGGYFYRDFVQNRSVIKEIELMEHSIVSIPSNPESIFEAAAKALGKSSMRPELSAKHFSQMQQLIGLIPIVDPDLRMMGDAERVERYEFLARQFTKAGLRPPGYDAWRELAPKLMSAKGKGILEPSQQMVAIVQMAKGHAVDEKRGRVLSHTNENELRGLRAMMEDAEQNLTDVTEGAKAIIAEAKGKLDIVLKKVEDEDEEDPNDEEGGTDGEDEGHEEDPNAED